MVDFFFPDHMEKTKVSFVPLPNSTKKVMLKYPEIDTSLQLKWGLALLGEEKAQQYLIWLRLQSDQRDK